MVKEKAFSTGGVIALSCWAPLHKQLPAQATPTNLEVPYLQVTEPTHLSQRAPEHVQSGASSRAKIGGAYFSDVTGSIQDPIAVPGPCEVT